MDKHYINEILNRTKIFARKLGDRYGRKLKDAAPKTGIDAAKAASKRVVQKTAEATGDVISNEMLIRLLQ